MKLWSLLFLVFVGQTLVCGAFTATSSHAAIGQQSPFKRYSTNTPFQESNDDNVRLHVATNNSVDTSSTHNSTSTRTHTLGQSLTYSVISSKYYLLTPKVWTTVACYTTLLVVLEWLYNSNKIIIPGLTPFMCCSKAMLDGGILERLVLPLLASSCCVIQLLINLVTGVGCVGFNSFLGPFRPLFVSVLVYATISTSTTIGRSKLIVSWFVTLMPELIHVLNMKRRNQHHNTLKKRFVEEGNDGMFTNDLKLQVSDMGCVACINKIENTMRNKFPESVVDVSSSLYDTEKGGEVLIKLMAKNEEESVSISNDIAEAIQSIGFTVLSRSSTK